MTADGRFGSALRFGRDLVASEDNSTPSRAADRVLGLGLSRRGTAGLVAPSRKDWPAIVPAASSRPALDGGRKESANTSKGGVAEAGWQPGGSGASCSVFVPDSVRPRLPRRNRTAEWRGVFRVRLGRGSVGPSVCIVAVFGCVRVPFWFARGWTGLFAEVLGSDEGGNGGTG